MSNGRLSGSTGRHPVEACGPRLELDAAVISLDEFGVRHVSQTHDGRPLGFTEPLESERSVRIEANRRLWLIQNNKRGRERARKGKGKRA